MNPNTLQATNLLVSVAIITWRDVKHPDPSWPLGPVPPPYRYAMAATTFGILAIVGQLFNASRLTSILGVGLVLGLMFQTFSSAATSPESSGGATGTGLTTAPTQV